jgi:hypothetical protein
MSRSQPARSFARLPNNYTARVTFSSSRACTENLACTQNLTRGWPHGAHWIAAEGERRAMRLMVRLLMRWLSAPVGASAAWLLLASGVASAQFPLQPPLRFSFSAPSHRVGAHWIADQEHKESRCKAGLSGCQDNTDEPVGNRLRGGHGTGAVPAATPPQPVDSFLGHPPVVKTRPMPSRSSSM